MKNLFMIAMVLVCTLENIIGVKGAEKSVKQTGKKLSIAFSHTQTSVQTKNRVE